jgi:hypothetical protein
MLIWMHTNTNTNPQMKINPVTEGDTQSIICSLKSKKTFSYDGISTEILKLCSSLISRPFSFICNKSILMGVFPDRLKYAVVKPLYKTDERSSTSDYRPISLLTVFSKILEKTMYHRLNQHLKVNNILVLSNRVSESIYLLNMQLIHPYTAYFMPGIVKFMLQETFMSWHRHSIALIIRF